MGLSQSTLSSFQDSDEGCTTKATLPALLSSPLHPGQPSHQGLSTQALPLLRLGAEQPWEGHPGHWNQNPVQGTREPDWGTALKVRVSQEATAPHLQLGALYFPVGCA